MMKKHFRLTIDLDIDLDNDTNGLIEQHVKELLEDLPKRAAGEGWFTGESPAMVDKWESKLEVSECIEHPEGAKPILMKTTFIQEVLHEPDDEERIEKMDFPDVLHECMDGDWSGQSTLVKTESYYTRKDADAAIYGQGSDPSFFFGDEEE